MKRKTFKSIAACAMAAATVLTTALSAVPVMAAGGVENLTITIHNNEGLPPLTDDRFDVYQLFVGRANEETDVDAEKNKFDKDLWKTENTNWYNMSLSDIEWGSSVNGEELISGLNALTPDDLDWMKGENPFAEVKTAHDVAKVLVDKDNTFLQGFAGWLLTNGNLTKLTVDDDSFRRNATEDGSSLTIKVPTQGYYLLSDSKTGAGETNKGGVVSEHMLAVLGAQDIYLKGDAPVLTKFITKAGEDTFEDKNDGQGSKGAVAAGGETITFKLTGTLPKNFENYDSYKYVFHDLLSKGLTYTEGSLKVSVTQKDPATQEDKTYVLSSDAQNYTVTNTANQAEEGGTKIEITFDDLRKKKLTVEGPEVGPITVTADAKFIVTYDATLNENAIAGYETEPGRYSNPNTAWIEYSNNPNAGGEGSTGTTPKDTVDVYTFGLDITKYSDAINPDSSLDQRYFGPYEGYGYIPLHGAGFILTTGPLSLNNDGTLKENDNIITQPLVAKFEVKSEEYRTYTFGIVGWENVGAQGSEFARLYNAYIQAKDAYNKGTDADRAIDGVKKIALDQAISNLAPYMLYNQNANEYRVENGLDIDTASEDGFSYTITEILTPAGYDTMKPVTLTLKGMTADTGLLTNVQYKVDETNYNSSKSDKPGSFGQWKTLSGKYVQHNLLNYRSPILPHTGGIGTTVVYAVSSMVLLFGSAVLFVGSRRRRSRA